MTTHHDLLVGTFNTPSIFTLRFTPPSQPSTTNTGTLKILKQHPAIGSHSWLHLNPPSTSSSQTQTLYATAWTEPPTLASYTVTSPTEIALLNTVPTNSRSGYVCASKTHAYSAGGATGEVYSLDPDTGAFTSPSQSSTATNGVNSTGTSDTKPTTIPPSQLLTFIDRSAQRDNGSTMDFGGLRHGAHSADLSPDGSVLYIADIGRNCIWVYSVSPSLDSNTQAPHLTLSEKKISPRSHDGPRHVHPHPNGRVVYCLQEHSSVVDVFEVMKQKQKQTTSDEEGEEEEGNGNVKLRHRQGVRIIPQGLNVSDFWADEVRTNLTSDSDPTKSPPKYLYASTRGLKEGQKGYVAVYALDSDGYVRGAEMVHEQPGTGTEAREPRDDDQAGLLDMYETVTSGGWANAIQPGPTVDGVEYLAMTDSEVGFIFVLGWDGRVLREVARVDLNEGVEGQGQGEGKGRHGAATAVWL